MVGFALAGAVPLAGSSVRGAVTYTVYTKADNTTTMTSSSSWVGGTAAPGASTDEALFDSTLSATTLSSSLSTGSLTVGLLSFSGNLNGAVTLNTASGNTFTLGGNSGDIIDMTLANQDVTLSGAGFLRLGALSGQQNFDVAAGRTLTVSVASLTTKGNSNTLGLVGSGNIILSSNAAPGSTTPLGLDIGSSSVSSGQPSGTVSSPNVTLSGNNAWNPNGSTAFALVGGTLNLASSTALQTMAGNNRQFSFQGGTITAAVPSLSIVANGGFAIGGSFAVGGSNSLTFGSKIGVNATSTLTNNLPSTANLTIGDLDLTNSSTSTTRVLTLAGAGVTTISGVISNGTSTGVGSLTYGGTNTLTLNGANTFSGTLSIAAGTTTFVQLQNALAAQNATVSLGTDNDLTFGSGITAATVAGLTGSAGLNLTNADSNGVALTVGNNNTGFTYSGVLSGANGSLVKAGTGVDILGAGGQSYGGTTTLTGGTLQSGTTGATRSSVIGAGALVLAGGALRFQSSGVTFNNDLVVQSAGGTLSFHGNSLFQPASITGTGTLNFDIDNGITVTPNSFKSWNGAVNVNTNGTAAVFRLDGAFDNTSLLNASLNLGTGIAMTRNGGTNGSTTTDIGALSGAAGSSLGGSSTGGGTFTFSVGSRNENSAFAGAIVDGGTKTGLTKVGIGTLTLSGANTYSRSTTINAGTLQVDGSLGDTPVAVNGGGTLAGKGTVNNIGTNTVAINGTIAPGAPATTAMLTTGAQAWNAGGSFTWKLNTSTGPASSPTQVNGVGTTDTAAGQNWDMLSMSSLSVQSTSAQAFTINVTPLNGNTPASSGTYTLADVTGGSVTIGGETYTDAANLSAALQVAQASGALRLNDPYNGSYQLGAVSDGASGEDITVSFNPAAAPEPTSIALLGVAFAGLTLRRRRR